MHIVVVGCGRVGSELAGHLEKDGHTVAIVDKRASAFRRLPTGFGGRTVVGFGFDRDTLTEAGIEQAGAPAAVTSGDNSNIMSAWVARDLLDRTGRRPDLRPPPRGDLPAPRHPDRGDRVLDHRPGDPAAAARVDGVRLDRCQRQRAVKRVLPAPWAGKRLGELKEPGRFTLSAVTRLGNGMVVDGTLVGQEGDILHIVTRLDSLDALQERLDSAAVTGGHH